MKKEPKTENFKRGKRYDNFDDAYNTTTGSDTNRLRTADARLKAQELSDNLKKEQKERGY